MGAITLQGTAVIILQGTAVGPSADGGHPLREHARPVFATAARFPHADEVVADWPHRYLEQTEVDARIAICVLTHDAKFDIPLLQLALRLPVGYVDAMGSRRTHTERRRLLREAGVTDEQLTRLRSPIGLDLGARTPEETAVSITAEIIAQANQTTGLPLAQVSGPLHRPAERDPGGRSGHPRGIAGAKRGTVRQCPEEMPRPCGSNLRCTCCIPGEDVQWMSKADLLAGDEIIRADFPCSHVSRP